MTNKRISIAIPAYKPDFLECAVRSVLCQTYIDFELIIVDDNPGAKLSDIVSQFNDPRIRYFRNEINLGSRSTVKAWNKCLEYATGEYFALLSDDDLYNADWLSEMVSLTKKYPLTDVFHSRVVKIDEGEKIIGFTPSCPEWESSLDFIWHVIHGFRSVFVSEFLCRTEALRNAGGFYDLPLAWGSDYVTWFCLASEGGIAFSKKCLVSWRVSEINISSQGNNLLRLKALEGYQSWVTSYLINYKANDLHESAILNQCQAQLGLFFRKKREHLLVQQIARIGRLNSMLRMSEISRVYGLSRNKIIYYLIKAYSS